MQASTEPKTVPEAPPAPAPTEVPVPAYDPPPKEQPQPDKQPQLPTCRYPFSGLTMPKKP